MKPNKPGRLVKIFLFIALILAVTLPFVIAHNTEPDLELTSWEDVDMTEIMKIDTIPVIKIDSDGEINTKKGVWTEGIKISVSNSNSNMVAEAKIKPRGSSSYTLGIEFGSLPYKIKFKEKQSVFGWKTNKNYLLIPTTADAAGVRNYIAYKTGKVIMGDKYWTPDVKLVEVYQNGEYLGLYDFVESIESDENRSNLEQYYNEESEKTPFIVELEMQSQDINLYTNRIQRNSEAFNINRQIAVVSQEAFDYQPKAWTTFALKYPDTFDDVTEAQGSYIVDKMENLYNGLHEKRNLSELDIDLESFARFYIVMDTFYNYGARSSLYYTCDGETITAGPIWDFDRSLYNFSTRHFLYRYNDAASSDVLYEDLFQYSQFDKAIQFEFNEFYEHVAPSLKTALQEMKNNKALADAWQRNENLRHRMADNNLLSEIYAEEPINPEVERRKTYEEQIDYIISFLYDGLAQNGDNVELDQPGRIEWMHNNLGIWKDAHNFKREGDD